VSLRTITVALFVAGVALMIPFEAWWTRLLGVLCLFAFVACGVFLVATPAYLQREDDETEPATPPA
jgi:O-antigen ligase